MPHVLPHYENTSPTCADGRHHQFRPLVLTAATTETIPPVSAPGAIPVQKTMKAFSSEQELQAYLRKVAEQAQQRGADKKMLDSALSVANVGAEPPAPAKAEAESVTNTQHAGVDEGGIVKVHGDHLVVLRRGRLFTVAIGDGALKPISSVDAFGPDLDPSSTWYDESVRAARV